MRSTNRLDYQENLLLKDPHISRVVVFGSGHFLNGVILEPAETGGSELEFLDKIWPTVVHANEIVPKHSRLLREMVLVRSDAKPIVLTDKGSVKTNETLRLYSSEIEEAYSRLEIDSQASVPVPETLDHAHLLVFVKTVVSEALGRKIDERSNLFDNGEYSAFQLHHDLILANRCRLAASNTNSLCAYGHRATDLDGDGSCVVLTGLRESHHRGFDILSLASRLRVCRYGHRRGPISSHFSAR